VLEASAQLTVPEEKPSMPSKSRRDRRLDRINRMLDKTSRELHMMKLDIGQGAGISLSLIFIYLFVDVTFLILVI
jgi:hypothetical protein